MINKNFSKIDFLDGIRGIAILFVVLYHVFGVCIDYGAPENPSFLTKVLSLVFSEGWVGVDIFFTISGFLITSILLNSKADKYYFSNFYIRRALRIFPLAILFIVIYFNILPFLYPTLERFQGLSLRQLWYWTYTYNFEIALSGKWIPPAHFWSLAIEEQFYFIWPLMAYFMTERKFFITTFIVLLLQVPLRFLLIQNGVSVAATTVIPISHLDGLMLGALLAGAWKNKEFLINKYGLIQIRKLFYVCLIFSVIGRFIIAVLPMDYEQKKVIFGITAWSFMTFSIIGICLFSEGKGLLESSLSNPLFNFFGKYSYGIYMINHQIVEFVSWSIRDLGLGFLSRMGLVFSGLMFIMIPVVMLSFHYFENFFLRQKENLSRK